MLVVIVPTIVQHRKTVNTRMPVIITICVQIVIMRPAGMDVLTTNLYKTTPHSRGCFSFKISLDKKPTGNKLSKKLEI